MIQGPIMIQRSEFKVRYHNLVLDEVLHSIRTCKCVMFKSPFNNLCFHRTIKVMSYKYAVGSILLFNSAYICRMELLFRLFVSIKNLKD